MTDPVLSIKDLHVSYRTQLHEFEALHAISLNVAPGGTHGIVGESGCGKSTLAAAMIGLLPTNGRVTAGEVLLDGDNILDLPEHELRKVRGRRIGMVFQDPLTSLNPTFKVSTQMINAQLAHAVVGVNRKDARHRAIEMLERVGIPDPEIRIDHYPHQFSGGMRQRIMIATMLLLKPAVLICDEATSALDVTLQAQILDMLKKLSKEEGTALVIISHDIGVISQMSDDVSVLYAGRTVESGPAQDVLLNPQHPYTRRLLASVPSRHRRDIGLSTIPGRVPSLAHLPTGCTFADRCYAAQDECRQAEPPLVKTASGLARCLVEIRDAADAAGLAPTNAAHIPEVPTEVVRPPVAVPDEPLLTAHGIEVTFVGGRKNPLKRDRHVIRAVDGVDLTLRRGEIIGLVGESGSGKTTLGKSLLRLVPVNAGSIDFEGTDLLAIPRRAWRSQRRRIQMIFQEPYGSLSPRMRVRGLITEPYVINQIPAEDRYTADQLLELVGLSTEQADKYPHELSGGQARRVGIARALAMQPDLIIADEPTAGLDVSAAAAALNLLRDLRSRLSLSQLIITHDLNIVGFIADRVMVMHEGRIVEAGNTRDVLDNPQHAYTQHLLSSVLSVPTKVG